MPMLLDSRFFWLTSPKIQTGSALNWRPVFIGKIGMIRQWPMQNSKTKYALFAVSKPILHFSDPKPPEAIWSFTTFWKKYPDNPIPHCGHVVGMDIQWW